MINFVVTNTDDSGPGSLRQAIQDANASQQPSVIEFDIGSGPQTIAPVEKLPVLRGSVSIDGSTQPGFAGTPLIRIRHDEAVLVAYGDVVNNATIEALDLSFEGNGPQGTGLFIERASDIRVRGLKISNRERSFFADRVKNLRLLDNDLKGSGTGKHPAISVSRSEGFLEVRGNTAGGGILINDSADADIRVLGNDLVRAGTEGGLAGAIQFNRIRGPLEVKGNTFGGTSNALSIYGGPDDLTISDGSVTDSQIVLDGLTDLSGSWCLLHCEDVDNLTIAGLDLSFAGENPQGTGLRVKRVSNITIRDLDVSNRDRGVSLQDVGDLMVSDGSVAGSNVVLQELTGLASPIGVWGVWDLENLRHEAVDRLDLSWAGDGAPRVGVRLEGENAARVLERLISGIEQM